MRKNKELIFRKVAGEAVLIPTGQITQRFNGIVTLTETAAFIWKHLEECKSLDELTQKITEEYDIDTDSARADAIEFIDALLSNGFVEYTGEDGNW